MLEETIKILKEIKNKIDKESDKISIIPDYTLFDEGQRDGLEMAKNIIDEYLDLTK